MLYTLQEWLKEITGLPAVTLQPCAGAHGELTGVMLIRQYHLSKGAKRRVILLPDSAHGTNPATAAMAGYDVVVVASQADGTVSFEDVTGADGKVQKGLTSLLAELGQEVAGIMITNPNTLGIFEHRIKEIADALHGVGALLYMDGANMNAMVGVARPGDFGVDVMHLNLHKTFSTPHGGGGPGSGPVACSKDLEPFLPRPVVVRETAQVGEGKVARHSYRMDWDRPASMGKVAGLQRQLRHRGAGPGVLPEPRRRRSQGRHPAGDRERQLHPQGAGEHGLPHGVPDPDPARGDPGRQLAGPVRRAHPGRGQGPDRPRVPSADHLLPRRSCTGR